MDAICKEFTTSQISCVHLTKIYGPLVLFWVVRMLKLHGRTCMWGMSNSNQGMEYNLSMEDGGTIRVYIIVEHDIPNFFFSPILLLLVVID
jgi:hypothetical protein